MTVYRGTFVNKKGCLRNWRFFQNVPFNSVWKEAEVSAEHSFHGQSSQFIGVNVFFNILSLRCRDNHGESDLVWNRNGWHSSAGFELSATPLDLSYFDLSSQKLPTKWPSGAVPPCQLRFQLQLSDDLAQDRQVDTG